MCISFYNNHAVQEASAERENNMLNMCSYFCGPENLQKLPLPAENNIKHVIVLISEIW